MTRLSIQPMHGAKGQLNRILSVIKFAWPFVKSKIFITALLMFLTGLTEGMSILLVVPVLASLQPGATTVEISLSSVVPNLPTFSIDLAIVLLLLVCAVALQGALSRASTLSVSAMTINATHFIRIKLFKAVAYARWEKIMLSRHADITHAITMDVDRIQSVLNSVLFLSQSLVMLAIYVVLAAMVSPTVTIAAVVFGSVFLLAVQPLRNFASRHGVDLSLRYQQQYRSLNEILNGLKVVKSLNAEQRYVDKFSSSSYELAQDITRVQRISALPPYIFQVVVAFGAAIFIFVAVRYISMPFTEIALILFLFMRLAPRFSSIQNNYQTLITNVGAYDNLTGVLNEYNENQEKADVPYVPRVSLAHDIVFDNVSFKYSKGSAAILSGVSFNIPARQITALIGASGSGKSTIADLLLGLLEPSTGAIRIDGKELKAAGLRQWREGVAYVPQEVYLINGTIRENLLFGCPEADDAETWNALDRAQAGELVRRLPSGLDTELGEDGARLSGGERQRVALARALLRKPDILILDEATSALDWQNQTLIADAIRELRGTVTVVTIAHRPSMIGFADWVVALDAGRVVETGHFSAIVEDKSSHLSQLLAGEAAQRT